MSVLTISSLFMNSTHLENNLKTGDVREVRSHSGGVRQKIKNLKCWVVVSEK